MTKSNESNQNEVAVAPKKELVNGTLVREENDYIVVIENGKHKRKMKYNEYKSIEAVTREERIWLANLIANDEDTGNGLKDQVGKEILVKDVIMRKYDKVNEDTGELEYGVLTYLITPEKETFVTSSKGVYFTLNQYMDMLGKPHEEQFEPMLLKIGKEKMQNGDAITIKLIG